MTSRSLISAQTGWVGVQRNPLGRLPCIWALLLIASVGALGCAANIQAPQSADKHAQHESKSRDAPVLDYPEHVAPPPAYGNKVVMAAVAEQSTHF